MCKFIGKSNERILCKLSKSEILRLYSIVHVAMETTKTSNFTCQSKSFISIFFTCQVSACELLPFFCHDLANDTYSQTAKTVFSHLNCSCKPGYSGNGHNCSGGCLRSFIYLLRLANPCRVTVTAHTELLGPVKVPSLMRNRPPRRELRPLLFKNSTWILYRPKEFICARVLKRGI